MRLTIPFILVKVAEHADLRRPSAMTAELKFLPEPDPQMDSVTRNLWLGDVAGILALSYCEKKMVEGFEVGDRVEVTIEVKNKL